MELLSSAMYSLDKAFPPLGVSKRDFYQIVAHVLGGHWTDFLSWAHLDQAVVGSEDVAMINALLKKKSSGAPLARVLGFVDFYGARIELNEHVLIPRPETEILLDKVLNKVADKTIRVVFDVCTGSGCLGIAFKKKNKDAKVYLTDVSKDALSQAKLNADLNDIDVSIIESDLFESIPAGLKADLVLCNPPYLSKKEYSEAQKSVQDYDPKIALIAGNEGLEFYERLSVDLPGYLANGALVALEIGYKQGKAVKEIFAYGPWKEIICEKDYAGLDRFIFLELH